MKRRRRCVFVCHVTNFNVVNCISHIFLLLIHVHQCRYAIPFTTSSREWTPKQEIINKMNSISMTLSMPRPRSEKFSRSDDSFHRPLHWKKNFVPYYLMQKPTERRIFITKGKLVSQFFCKIRSLMKSFSLFSFQFNFVIINYSPLLCCLLFPAYSASSQIFLVYEIFGLLKLPTQRFLAIIQRNPQKCKAWKETICRCAEHEDVEIILITAH